MVFRKNKQRCLKRQKQERTPNSSHLSGDVTDLQRRDVTAPQLPSTEACKESKSVTTQKKENG